MPDVVKDKQFWEDRTRINLHPTAPPSVLGLFAMAAATFVVGSNFAGWYRDPHAMFSLFPLVGVFGGLTQLLSAMWCYRARDSVGAALHGSWSALWAAFTVLNLLMLLKLIPTPATLSTELGVWLLVISAITWLIAVAATGESFVLAGVCTALALAALFSGLGECLNSTALLRVGGWVFVVAALLSLYHAAALMLEEMFSRKVLPIGRPPRKEEARGDEGTEAIEFGPGMPGARKGQ